MILKSCKNVLPFQHTQKIDHCSVYSANDFAESLSHKSCCLSLADSDRFYLEYLKIFRIFKIYRIFEKCRGKLCFSSEK